MVHIVFYHEADKPAAQFFIPLAQGWLFYESNFEFEQHTNFSATTIEIFNPKTVSFAAIMNSTALYVDPCKYPWLIMCEARMIDAQCPNLPAEILALFDTRERINRPDCPKTAEVLDYDVAAGLDEEEVGEELGIVSAAQNADEGDDGLYDVMPGLEDFIERDDHVMGMADKEYVEGPGMDMECEDEEATEAATKVGGKSAIEDISSEDEVEVTVLGAPGMLSLTHPVSSTITTVVASTTSATSTVHVT